MEQESSGAFRASVRHHLTSRRALSDCQDARYASLYALCSLNVMLPPLHLRPALGRLCRAYPPRLQHAGRPSRRTLYLAPPFLLDDYVPRYHLVSSADASKKRSLAYAHLRECNLCPRLCGVNRYEKTGVCLIGAEKVKVNTIAPHFGEGVTITLRSTLIYGNIETDQRVNRALLPGSQWLG